MPYVQLVPKDRNRHAPDPGASKETSMLLRVLALAALGFTTACQEDTCPEATVCDVAERDCQQQIMRAVSCLRGGEVELPPVSVVTESELSMIIGQRRDVDPEEERAYALWNRGLSLLNLAPADYSLESSQADMVSEIAAVYFSDTKEIVVVDRGESLADRRAVEVFAHEVVHALQDADYDLRAYKERWSVGYDAARAVDGIVEGEAVLYQLLISLQLEGLSPTEVDWQRYFERWRGETLELAEQDEAPVAMADLRFPYAFGGGYVTQFYLAGGREAVDALISRPPLTTREVMFGPLADTQPEAEADFWSRAVPALGDPFELISASSLGAWISRVFAARMGISVDQRLSAAERLLDDVVSIQADEASGQVVAAWRVRMQQGTAADFPGVGHPPRGSSFPAVRFESWTDSTGKEAFMVAAEPAVDDPTTLAWQSVMEADEGDQGSTAAPRLAEAFERPSDLRGCDVRRPDFFARTSESALRQGGDK
jgi:hypothetical protein